MSSTQKAGAIRQLIPLLFVQNIEASLSFYRDRLGFEVASKWEPEGRLAWCSLQRDGSAVMLQQATEEDEPAEGRGHGVIFYFNCNDVVAIHSEFARHGLGLEPPKVAFYGMSQLSMVDPDGYALCFQSPTSPAQ